MRSALPQLTPQDALIIVDVQNDFIPGGALPIAEGDQVIPVLNRWIDAAVQAGATVVASRDWHPKDHCSFKAQGGPWPAHCVQGTAGAEFHPDLELPVQTMIISTADQREYEQYSTFGATGLGETLRASGIDRLWIGGLALDVCVRATVLDALKEGFEVHLILAATRPVDVHPGDGDRALAEMRQAGAVIEEE